MAKGQSGGRKELNYEKNLNESQHFKEKSLFSSFIFFRLFEITATYMSNVIPLTQLLILESTCFAHQKQGYQSIWPTFITLIHNMTLLHHLSTPHFSSPKALVTEVTDGDCVRVFECIYACLCTYVCANSCVQVGSVSQVVFELIANHGKFACPYVSTRSYTHHLSQYDANLALLS